MIQSEAEAAVRNLLRQWLTFARANLDDEWWAAGKPDDETRSQEADTLQYLEAETEKALFLLEGR